jgi:Domain of unknown function (DUF4124)
LAPETLKFAGLSQNRPDIARITPIFASFWACHSSQNRGNLITVNAIPDPAGAALFKCAYTVFRVAISGGSRMQRLRGPFPSVFRATAVLPVLFAALLVNCCLATNPAFAQTIYKWVDERGVVNYGNAEVPKSKDVSIVDTAPQVVSQPDVKAREAKQAKAVEADSLREQLQRSRDEVARLRQNSAQGYTGGNTSKGSDSFFAAWREDCERKHRTDCTEATYAAETQAVPAPGALRPPANTQPAPPNKAVFNKPAKDASMQFAGAGKLAPGATKPITVMQ